MTADRTTADRSCGRRRSPGIALSLVATVILAACFHDDARALSSDAAYDLLAGNIVEGYHHKKEYHFRRYYDPAGRFRSINTGTDVEQSGAWRIESNGVVCILWDGDSDELCRNIVSSGGSYKKVLIKPDGKRIDIISYSRFATGSADDL